MKIHYLLGQAMFQALKILEPNRGQLAELVFYRVCHRFLEKLAATNVGRRRVSLELMCPGVGSYAQQSLMYISIIFLEKSLLKAIK